MKKNIKNGEGVKNSSTLPTERPSMDYLANKFYEVSGVSVPPHYFYLREGKLLIAPYDSPGIEFDQNGNWKKNEGETFHIRFLHEYYEVLENFGKVLRETDFSLLKEVKSKPDDPYEIMEENCREWEFRASEMSTVLSFIGNYWSGVSAPSARMLGEHFGVFHTLINLYLNGSHSSSENEHKWNIISNISSENVSVEGDITKSVTEDVSLPQNKLLTDELPF